MTSANEFIGVLSLGSQCKCSRSWRLLKNCKYFCTTQTIYFIFFHLLDIFQYQMDCRALQDQEHFLSVAIVVVKCVIAKLMWPAGQYLTVNNSFFAMVHGVTYRPQPSTGRSRSPWHRGWQQVTIKWLSVSLPAANFLFWLMPGSHPLVDLFSFCH